RDALAAAKARGQRLGRPRATPDAVVAQIVALRDDGLTVTAIAKALTARQVPTTRGADQWRPSSVRRVLRGHALDLLASESLASREQESA
ncbi:MAG: recombinase family protein, partial [Nocardioides sp.]